MPLSPALAMSHASLVLAPVDRTSATNPSPAILGRDPTETKTPEQISERVRISNRKCSTASVSVFRGVYLMEMHR